jgi:cobalt/nickel transport system permease protein
VAHIPDGVLSAPVLATGALVSAGLLAVALRHLDEQRLPQAAVLAAAFFVSSLISVPAGPSTVHLLLNGLMGLVLGWNAVPALLVALLLQAAFFGYGGVIVLGVNMMNVALPALLCGLALRPMLRPIAAQSVDTTTSARAAWSAARRRALAVGAAAGLLGVLLTGLLVAVSLAASGRMFVPAAKVIALTYVPLALVEGLITAVVVAFLVRVEPRVLALGGGRHG